MSLTGKTLAATYHGLLKLSTTDNQNFDGTLRNIVDGEDTASNLSLTDPSTGISILQVDGSHANGTALRLNNSATDGDVSIAWRLSGTTHWYFGLEDGDSDKLKLCHSGDDFTSEKITLSTTEIVINDDSGDVDFRVQSNNENNMFFVDGGNDEIGIGTATPAAKVHIYDNAANEGAVGGMLIEQDHASGDAGLTFLISGTEQYVMGIDHSSTADYFKITDGANFSSGNAGITIYGDRVWCGLPNGTAMPSDDFGAYVTGEQMDARFVSATSTSHLHVDGATNSACYIDFDEAGTRRGYIQYDQEASGSQERMNFYVNDEASKALSLAADSNGVFCSMGGTANTTDSFEIVGNSSERGCLTLHDTGSGTYHYAGFYFKASPIRGASAVSPGGYIELQFVGGGPVQVMLGGSNGQSIAFFGYMGSDYISSVSLNSADDVTAIWDSATVGTDQKIRFRNDGASTWGAMGIAWHASTKCVIVNIT